MSADDARNIDAYPAAFHSALQDALAGQSVPLILHTDKQEVANLRRRFRAFIKVAKYNPRYRQALDKKRVSSRLWLDRKLAIERWLLTITIVPETDFLEAYEVKRILNRAKLLSK